MNLKLLAICGPVAAVLAAAPGQAQAPKPDYKTLAATGILERLAERSGVYGVASTAKVPGFIADAGWPQKLPNNWIIGQVGGLYVAPDDHVWIYQRPRTLTSDEAALTTATHKSKDGKPVDAMGFLRPYGALGDCCLPAPSVMEFDSNGKLLRAWGGPADPDKCKAGEGCVWPATEHGIFVDDKASAAAGDWMADFAKGNMKPAFFRNPVHCVKISKEGLIYVCDRGNNRIQVFNGRDPILGKECLNPAGEAGKCGFVKEQSVALKTNGLPGSAVSMNFSTDAKQSCLYVGDNSNMTMYVLKRETLEELGRLGRSGRETGEFHWLHQVSIDSHGNLYTAEVDTGKRIQKFIRFGDEGCSGTGRKTVGEVLP